MPRYFIAFGTSGGSKVSLPKTGFYPGRGGCPEGSRQITTPEECAEAVREVLPYPLQHKYSDGTIGTVQGKVYPVIRRLQKSSYIGTKIPSGCSFQMNGDLAAHWNTANGETGEHGD